jgi:signal peptidase I
MEPTLDEGDWLLIDPTTERWPRRGSVVAFHQPDTGTLAVKRVAGTPGDRIPFREGYLELADDEAWLISDADEATTIAAGYGAPIDSNQFGPVPVELLVGRVWFRYGPLRRLGPIARLRRRPDHRGVDGGGPSRVASPGIEPMDPLTLTGDP